MKLNTGKRLNEALASRFSLFSDKASNTDIDQRIRDSVSLQGAALWVLMFAILIASIGLNVNSPSFITGAMLISPLMGPVMGIGHGTAIYDFDLVKKSFTNLAIAAVISLLVSTLYFLLTPLRDAQSELLARTSPTVWDVLVALLGGLAGIIGVTRRKKSNVIPGVAIATALMPPLCTAGYALAMGKWNFFIGAVYLFSINTVFIALATALGITLLKFPKHVFVDKIVERRVKMAFLTVALCTALPSGYLASKLVKDELFKSKAKSFVAREFIFDKTFVARTSINKKEKTIEIALIGLPLEQTVIQQIEDRLTTEGLTGAKMYVYQTEEDDKLDVVELKSSLFKDLYQDGQDALQLKEQQIKQLKKELYTQTSLLNKAENIANELRAQFPAITTVVISNGVELAPNAEKKNVIQLSVKSDIPINAADQERIESWFKIRTKSAHVYLSIDSQVVPKQPVRGK